MLKRLQTVLIATLTLLLLAFLWTQRPAPSGASAAAGPPAGQGDQWQRSDAQPPPGTPLQQLSPPDARPSGALQDDAVPQTPAGVILRDFRLLGSVFRPRSSDVGFDWGSGGGCIYNSSGDPAEIWNAPVALPQGATVNTVRFYYDDQSADLNAMAWFSVYDLFGALVNEWPMSSTGDDGYGIDDTSPVIDHTIDYRSYAYALNWRPLQQGPTMQLCGFRIFYEAPPFGLNFFPYAAKN